MLHARSNRAKKLTRPKYRKVLVNHHTIPQIHVPDDGSKSRKAADLSPVDERAREALDKALQEVTEAGRELNRLILEQAQSGCKSSRMHALEIGELLMQVKVIKVSLFIIITKSQTNKLTQSRWTPIPIPFPSPPMSVLLSTSFTPYGRYYMTGITLFFDYKSGIRLG